jgi:hypothetical protein
LIDGLRRLGKTIFLTTHYMDEAEALADRIAVLKAGQIVAEGTPTTLGGRDRAAYQITFTLPEGVAIGELPTEAGAPSALGESGKLLIESEHVMPTLRALSGWAIEHRAWVLIASRVLTSVILASAIVAVIVAIGRVVYGVHLPGATLPAFLLGLIVGAAAFCCLSFAAASFIRNEDSAQPIVQAIILPLYFISGVLVPRDELSSTLREIASVFPVSHLDSALFKAFDPATTGSGVAVTDLLILAIWGAAGLLIALWRFKWSPQST